MIVLFEQTKNHLIVVPHRCGTGLMMKIARDIDMNVVPFVVTDNTFSIELIKQFINKATKKTFITREPVERYLSFFKAFRDASAEGIYKNYVLPKKKTNSVFRDLNDSMLLLKENYELDVHTRPQYTYFKLFEQSIDDYEIVNVNNITKWIYLTFVKKIEDNHTSTLKDFPLMQDIIEFTSFMNVSSCIKEIYKQDYLIYEKATTL